VSSTRTRAERQIAADPTSTALLLAGPSALELWPGVRCLGEVGGRVLVEVDAAVPEATPGTEASSGTEVTPVTGPVTAASVTAQPPLRTPTAFVTRFAWTGPDLPGTDGVLTLTYAPGEGRPSTWAELVLDSTGLESSRLDADGLARMAQAFLANLGEAAESRRAA